MSFWERRRAGVAREDAEAAAARREAERVRHEEALAEKSDAELLAHFDLPDPDALKPGDTIVAFMKREVPERLRRRAMRALWRSNPVLACVDGLNDYDGDYTNAATDAPNVLTSYIPGKGMRAHVEALAREAEGHTVAERESPEPEVETEVTTVVETAVEPDVAAEADTTLVAVHSEAPSGTSRATAETEAEAPRPRRMRFRFDGAARADQTRGEA